MHIHVDDDTRLLNFARQIVAISQNTLIRLKNFKLAWLKNQHVLALRLGHSKTSLDNASGLLTVVLSIFAGISFRRLNDNHSLKET